MSHGPPYWYHGAMLSSEDREFLLKLFNLTPYDAGDARAAIDAEAKRLRLIAEKDLEAAQAPQSSGTPPHAARVTLTPTPAPGEKPPFDPPLRIACVEFRPGGPVLVTDDVG